MSNSLEVKISADVARLQSQLSVAQAELRATVSEMNTLAKAVPAPGANAEQLEGQLLALSETMLAQKAHVAELKDGMAELGATTGSGLTGSFRSATEGLEEMGARMSALTTAMRGFAEAAGAAFAVERIGSMVTSTIELGSSLQHMSEQTGVSVEALSVLRTQAKLDEVDFDSFGQMLRKLSVSAEEAIQKAGAQRDAYEALGISTKDLIATHGDTLQLLLLVSNAMKGAATKTGVLAVSQELLGRNSQEAIRFLRDLGTEGFDAARAKAQELGTYYDHDFAEVSEAAAKATKEFDLALESLKVHLAALVLPGVTAFLRELRDLLTWNTADAGLIVMQQQLAEGEIQAKALEASILSLKDAGALAALMYRDWLESTLADLNKNNAALREQIQLAEQAAKVPSGASPASGGSDGGKDIKATGEAYSDAKLKFQQWVQANVQGLQDTKAMELEYWREVIASGQLGSAAQQEAQTRVFELTRQLRKEQLDETLADLKEQEAAQAGNTAKIIELARQEADAVISTYGRESAEGKNAERAYLDAVTKATAEANAVKAKATDDQIERLNKELQAGLQHDQALFEQGQISASQRAQMETQLVESITTQETKLINDLEQLYAKNSKDWQTLEDKKKQIAQQGASEIEKINDQQNKALQQSYQMALKPIQSGFDTMLHGMMSGHETFRQAVVAGERQMAMQIIEQQAQVLEKKLADYLADELAFLMGEEAKQVAQQSTNDSGLIMLAAKAIKAIVTGSAETFAGIFGFLSGEMGPAAAAPAAAGAAAVMAETSLVSAAGGLWNVPSDNFLINAHMNEAVLPASIAAQMRSFFETGSDATGGAGAGGAPIVVHLQPNISSALTPQSINLVSRQLAQAVAREFNSNPSIRPTY